MRWTTLGAIAKAPELLHESLERRNQEKAEEVAQALTDFFSGAKRARKQEQEVDRKALESYEAEAAAKVNSGSDWGGDGWGSTEGW